MGHVSVWLRFVGILLGLSAGCKAERILVLSPSEVAAGVVDQRFSISGLFSADCLEVRGTELRAVEDLRVEIGGAAAIVEALYGDRIEVRLPTNLVAGRHDLVVTCRGRSFVGKRLLTIRAAATLDSGADGSFDAGALDGALDGADDDGADDDASDEDASDAGTPLIYQSLQDHRAADFRVNADAFVFGSESIQAESGCGTQRTEVAVLNRGFDLTDYRLRVRFRVDARCDAGAGGPAILVRAQNTRPMCEMVESYLCYPARGQLLAGRAEACMATGTTVPTLGLTLGSWYELHAEVRGDTVTCTLGGGPEGARIAHRWTDPAAVRPRGTIGLSATGARVSFDDVELRWLE
ncbi:MAG: hypothetical protein AAGF12_23690 [Myxococcota bacterium]